MFAGVTDTKYDTVETFGVEGSYHANDKVSVGFVVEHMPDAGDGYEANLVLGTVSYEVLNNFRIIGGAGREYHHGHEKPVWRLGAAYDIHVAGLHISPTVAVDFLEGDENLVAGVAIGKGF